MNTASSVSINDADTPLVCCRPQANATGPMTAPNNAIASSRLASVGCSCASLSLGLRMNAATRAAPPYNNAAVVNGPTPCPHFWTKGVLRPNRAAASNASRPPLTTGVNHLWFTAYWPVKLAAMKFPLCEKKMNSVCLALSAAAGLL